MTNQLPSDWGQPQWGAKPESAGGPPPGARPTATRADRQEGPSGQRPAPGAGPRGRPKPRRALLSGVMVGLLAIMTALIVAFILLVMWVVSMARGPIDATNAFVADVNEGRLDAAYASMCGETKATYSLQDFTSHMAASGVITGYTFVSASLRSNEQTIVSGTIEVDEVPRAADFGLREEDDTWKVCSYPLIQESRPD